MFNHDLFLFNLKQSEDRQHDEEYFAEYQVDNRRNENTDKYHRAPFSVSEIVYREKQIKRRQKNKTQKTHKLYVHNRYDDKNGCTNDGLPAELCFDFRKTAEKAVNGQDRTQNKKAHGDNLGIISGADAFVHFHHLVRGYKYKNRKRHKAYTHSEIGPSCFFHALPRK
jgi:hypothetical protein